MYNVYDRQQRNESVLNVTDMCVYMYNCLFVDEMHDCDVCVPEAILDQLVHVYELIFDHEQKQLQRRGSL